MNHVMNKLRSTVGGVGQALARLGRRLSARFRPNALDSDMDREMRAHLELLAEEHERSGLARDEARRAARRRFGNVGLLKERGRDVRGLGFAGDLWREVRYAVRGLRRTPGFTVAVILTLALGVGANTAIFSVVDRALLRPLPYPDGERLVMVYEDGLEALGTLSRFSVSPANWMDWQRASRSFSALAAWSYTQAALTGEDAPEVLDGQFVSAEFFPLLGVSPMLGRVFTGDEDRPGAERVVVLSHGLWQRRFGGDPEILGRTIALNETPHQVIGVMPPDFRFVSTRTSYWAPYALDRNRAWRDTAGRFISVLGRLRPDVAFDAAQAEMRTLAQRLAETYDFNRNTTVTLSPLREELTGEVRTSLLVLFAAVGALLSIACLNVAGLLLARGVRRRHELAVRASLGASRGAILRQLFTESLVLALLGGAAGILVAQWAMAGLAALTPDTLLRMTEAEMSMDHRILFYTVGVSIATGLLFGLAPAVTAGRESLRAALATVSRTATRTARLRRGIVVAQIALTLVLLSGAGLLARSFRELIADEAGLRTENVLTFSASVPTTRYDRGQQIAFFQRAIATLENLPGVTAAGAERSTPITGPTSSTVFHVQGTPETPLNERPFARIRVATPGYFRTLGIPVLQGRDFSADDQREGAPLVFVVNEAFARQYFPAGDALDAAMSVWMSAENPYGPIVGIVGDVKEGGLRAAAEPTIFYDHSHLPSNGMAIFVRTTSTTGLPTAVTAVIRDLDPNVPVNGLAWLEDVLADSAARERLNAVVSTAFALTALFLAAFGLYGLLSFLVAERRREIGIRMALGARTSEVLGLMMRQGLRLVVPGVLLGLAGALLLSRAMTALLYGVTATDPATFAVVTGLLVAVAGFATFLPARRATRIDPMIVLREE